MEQLHQWRIFALWVAHDHMVAGFQNHAYHLALTGKGLAPAGCTEYQPVGRTGILAIQHDHVAGFGVQTVIKGVAAHEQLLCHKGNDNRDGRGRHSPCDFDLAYPQRQGRYKPLFLLEVQTGKLAVVFLRHSCGAEHVIFQLAPGIAIVQHKESDHEITLIAALQFV